MWPLLLPALACAVCPACVTMYAKLLSLVGVGFGLSEFQHELLLAVAVTVSLAVSGWRTLRSGRVWPLAVALLGTALVLAGHLEEELHALEWLGVLTLLAGGLAEQFRLRRVAARASV